VSGEVEKLLTAEEVAELLGVCKLTVYEMARAGRIKRVELGLSGRAIRFRPSDVRAFVERSSTNAPTMVLHRRRRRVS